MKKLTNVKYVMAEQMLPEHKEELGITIDEGTIAIETWAVDGKLETTAKHVKSYVDYILGLGDFKDA